MGAIHFQPAAESLAKDLMSDSRDSRISNSTPPIRALLRGLHALTVLNLRGAASAAEVASEINVPRTTTYRILETLATAGFLERASTDERYHPTALVHLLAEGADEEARLTQTARPLLFDLCREIDWRVAIATPSGSAMRVRETTEQPNATRVERYSAAFHIPMLTTASGLAYLAHCAPRQRRTLLDALARSRLGSSRGAMDHDRLEREFERIRAQGYATYERQKSEVEEISLATPVLAARAAAATLTVRFERSTLPFDRALERFLPALRRTAERIGERLLAVRSGAAHDLPSLD